MFTLQAFSQQDPRWKNVPLGLNPQVTIGKMGCLLTDLAMVVNGFGFDETPLTLNQKLVALGENGGFRGELVIPAALQRILPGMIFRDFMECRSQAAPMERIDAALAAGWPVIVELDYDPQPGLQNHWVVLTGRQAGDYLLQDPWPYPAAASQRLSTSRYAFAGSVEKIITSVLWLEGPRQSAAKPNGAISVFTTVEDLALRSQPQILPDNLIKRVPLLSELYSLESVEVTLIKVGVLNQWLQVQDDHGVQGFAAAWYLNTRREVPGQPLPLPTIPVGQPLKVYTNVDQLALRSRPLVAPETLLKRLPQGCALVVLESAADAVRKVGTLDLWLHVSDPAGEQGYVAAWYTTLTPYVGLGPAIVPLAATPPVVEQFLLTTVPSLALRSRPQMAEDNLLRRLPFETRLQVLESPRSTRAKVGAPGQWLRVKDADGQEGYVAAWFVRLLTET